MRISTTDFTQGQVSALTRLQAELQRTQSQLSSGTKLLSPADDPAAAARVQQQERWLSAAEQYQRNGDQLGSRLGLQEGALADTTDILMRVRELAVQGGNGALDQSARRLIATEVRTQLDQLMQVANRRLPSGEYLFAGTSSGVEPFARQGGAVQYAGDDQSRLIEIAPGNRVGDALPGSDVFVRIPAGNGSFSVRADAGNTGTGLVGAGTVVDTTAWDGALYRVVMTPTGGWEARDGVGAVVASGTFSSGGAIEFKGIRLTITGTPAAGDQFQITPSGTEDLFATFERLATALEAPLATAAQRASATNELNAVLAQFTQSQEHLSAARAVLGSRLAAVEGATTSREAAKTDVTTELSRLRDTDYAETLSRLNMQLTGLQAAQQSVARLSRMSLFDYL